MAKMKKCKSCGKEIAVSAKTCPGCGAKNKKPFYQTVWFWVIAVIVLIIIWPGGKSNENATEGTDNNTETKVIEYQKVNIDELEDALHNNAAAAKDTYKGKYLEIYGKLGTIDSDLKYISLDSTTKEFDLDGVHCALKNQKSKDVVKTLSKGQIIIVKGKITDVGEVLGYYLDVDEIIPQ